MSVTPSCLQRFLTAISITCTFAGMPGTSSGTDIYKWVDENGTTHYSDEKPLGVESKLVPETGLSVIPGNRIGTQAARAVLREQAGLQNPRWVVGVPQLYQGDFTERRANLLRDCRANHGVDCEREVDIELRAENLQEGARVIHLAPPPVKKPSPGPVPAPKPSGSALR